MAACLSCRQYLPKPGDLYCGLCGEPLCRLWIDSDGILDVPADKGRRVVVSASVRNAARSRTTLRFELLPPDGDVVKVLDECAMDLEPSDTPTEIRLEVDVEMLREQPSSTLVVPFKSSDPRRAHGSLRLCLATPGELQVELPQQPIDLGLLDMPPRRGLALSERSLSIDVTNEGGGAVQLSLKPPESGSRIGVRFKEGEHVWIAGHERRSIELAICSLTDKIGAVEDSFLLNLPTRQIKVDVKAQVRLPPQLECDVVDFGTVVAGERRTQTGVIRNLGTETCTITRADSLSDSVKVLTSLPLEVPSGKDGVQIELFLCAKDHRYAMPGEATDIYGGVLLHTDLPGATRIGLQWRARALAPETSRRLVFAVDFGTVNSCVAWSDGTDQPGVFDDDPDDDEEGIVPSLLAFLDKDSYVVGKRAVEAQRTSPRNAIGNIKRFLVEGNREFFGQTYTPVELARILIGQMLLRATRLQGIKPSAIALTVPANFWGPLRDAMIRACKDAWPELDQDSTYILDEPTSAAMYYVSTHQEEFGDLTTPKRILVFDFGGGTLDVCVVQLEAIDRHIHVTPLIARGDNLLGGIDVDLAILKFLADKVKKDEPSFERNRMLLSGDKFAVWAKANSATAGTFQAARFSWIEESREAKEELSKSDVSEHRFSNLLVYDRSGHNVTTARDYKLTENEFDPGLIDPMIKAALRLISSTLDACNLEPDDIDVVLMAGQSCRIPAVVRALEKEFPNSSRPSDETVFPLKQSVAKGAAWTAYGQLYGEGTYIVHKLSTTSHRYGILESDTRPGWCRFSEIIKFNVPFDEARNDIKVELTGIRIGVEIVQYDGTEDIVERTDRGLVVVGTVELDANHRTGTISLGLGFSFDSGRLMAYVDGQPIDITPSGQQALERTYL